MLPPGVIRPRRGMARSCPPTYLALGPAWSHAMGVYAAAFAVVAAVPAANSTAATSSRAVSVAGAVWIAAACMLVLSCCVIVACTPRNATPVYKGFVDNGEDSDDESSKNATGGKNDTLNESLI